MLQACLNGNAQGPNVPETPAALAADVAAVHGLGVRHVHLHPRDSGGAETLRPDIVAAVMKACRAARPDVSIGFGTGAWITPGPGGRIADMQGWRTRPDYVSVNLNEEDAPEVIALMRALGVGVEAGIWSLADAERFCELDLPPQIRILIEMPDQPDVDSEVDRILATLKAADRQEPVLLHGEAETAWPCLRRAVREGFSSRMGFEDCQKMPDGSTASDNTALLKAAVRIFEDAGRPLS